jgi:membrane protein implicated in regulation of membrane protease activity
MIALEWWHWMIAGVALMLLELAIPAFFVVWFGLGALIVGLLLLVAPSLSFAGQLITWIAASIAFVILWVKVFKAGVHRTTVGLSKGQFAGEYGLVTRDIQPFQKGQIRFQKPILGSETWEAIADEKIIVGERIEVLDVEGQILRVAKRR